MTAIPDFLCVIPGREMESLDSFPFPFRRKRSNSLWKRVFKSDTRPRKVDIRLPGKLPWREASPPNHHDDRVDSDQKVINKEVSIYILVKMTLRARNRFQDSSVVASSS